MAKRFVIRLINSSGQIVANSKIVTYHDLLDPSQKIKSYDFTDGLLTGNVTTGTNYRTQTFKTLEPPPTPSPSPSPTPSPSPSPTPTPTPTPTRSVPIDRLNYCFATGDLSNIDSVTMYVPGWYIYLSEVRMNGQTNILGCPTPDDPTPIGSNPPMGYTRGDEPPVTGINNISAFFLSGEVITGQPPKRYINLMIDATSSEGYGIVRGPYAVTELPITLATNDVVSFLYQAIKDADDYDIIVYLQDVNDCARQIILLNITGVGTTPWTEQKYQLKSGEGGDYKVVFIGGSYDASGLKGVGAIFRFTCLEIQQNVFPIPTGSQTPAPDIFGDRPTLPAQAANYQRQVASEDGSTTPSTPVILTINDGVTFNSTGRYEYTVTKISYSDGTPLPY